MSAVGLERAVLFRLTTSERLERVVKALPFGEAVAWRAASRYVAGRSRSQMLVSAASLGMPVSTTHAITTSIMGVGCAKRWNALNLPVIARILIAWVLTIPATAFIGWLVMKLWLASGAAIQ